MFALIVRVIDKPRRSLKIESNLDMDDMEIYGATNMQKQDICTFCQLHSTQ